MTASRSQSETGHGAGDRRLAPVPGVIDSIADGLSIVLARPALLAVPLALDLYFWLGWKFSAVSMTSWLQRRLGNHDAGLAGPLERAGRADAAAILATLVPAHLVTEWDNAYALWERPALAPGQWWAAAAILVGLVVAATFLLSAYLVPLADAAVQRSRSAGSLVSAIALTWARTLGIHVVMLTGVVIFVWPAAIGWFALRMIGVDTAAAAVLLAIAAGSAAAAVWIFAVQAVPLQGIGPLAAIRSSFQLVRDHTRATAGLMAAGLLIILGLGQIWRTIDDTPPGLLIAVVANAFFACGLTLAAMLFFQRRATLLEPPGDNPIEPAPAHIREP